MPNSALGSGTNFLTDSDVEQSETRRDMAATALQGRLLKLAPLSTVLAESPQQHSFGPFELV